MSWRALPVGCLLLLLQSGTAIDAAAGANRGAVLARLGRSLSAVNGHRLFAYSVPTAIAYFLFYDLFRLAAER